MQIGKIEEEAKQLQLASITLSNSLRYGMFGSLFVGQGIDFDSCREYELNDDIRYIDWNLTARTGHPFVKLYNEERDIALFVIIDASDSMSAYTVAACGAETYFEKAKELAALFFFAGFHLSCRIGGIIFSDTVEKLVVPKQGSDFVFSLIHILKNMTIKESAKSNLSDALKLTSSVLTKRSLVVVISDFKINNYEKKLSLLSKTHDIIAIKIFSENDYALPNCGLLELYDSENNTGLFINTASKKSQLQYKQNFDKDLQLWENRCIDIGVLPCKLSLTANPVKEITRFLMSAKNKYEAIGSFKKNRQA